MLTSKLEYDRVRRRVRFKVISRGTMFRMIVSDKMKLRTESRSVESQISNQLATVGIRATRLCSSSFQNKAGQCKDDHHF